MLAQLIVLIIAPLFALITQGEPVPSRTPTWAEPLAMGARLWIRQMDGQVTWQGWDRSEVAVVVSFHDGDGGGRAELEVRQASHGLVIAVRIPRQSDLLGLHRAPHCQLMIKTPRRGHGAGAILAGG